jgi:hypothetical protein
MRGQGAGQHDCCFDLAVSIDDLMLIHFLQIKNAANYVGDKTNELTSGASKEYVLPSRCPSDNADIFFRANKNVAKDSDASLGTRATAAKDAVSDKVDETTSSASAAGNKEAAKH